MWHVLPLDRMLLMIRLMIVACVADSSHVEGVAMVADDAFLLRR
jgi:uncharacterized membrane protein YcgQ (UPF0703/DUF1980 family)